MPTVRALLTDASHRLGDRREVEVLLTYALGRERSWLFAHADDVPSTATTDVFKTLVARRAGGEPMAYITGRRGFWSLDLEVAPVTLIPRAETELLVEQALERIPSAAACAVADLGTGSGAVALALAAERPQAHIVATDASADALAVAARNAARLHLANVHFARGDWCAALGDARFDVIVSNPPYIGDDDAHLHQGDLRFEPRAALASGGDGLDAIRRIVHDTPAHLQAGGWLLFEHGWNQGEAARALLRVAAFVDVFTAQDLEARDRVSGGRRA